MPTLSTGEPTLSITHIPVLKNPYIYSSNLPSNLVFIVIGAILGAILLLIILYRITAHFKYNRKAMNEKETYYTNLTEILNQKGAPYSRNSSILITTPLIYQVHQHHLIKVVLIVIVF